MQSPRSTARFAAQVSELNRARPSARHRRVLGGLLVATMCALGGCAQQKCYVNDGASYDDPDAPGLLQSASSETRSAAFVPPRFPIVLAVARVQRGRPLRLLSPVGRDAMSEEELGRLAMLPHVRKIAPITLWETEPNAGSIAQLRTAARRLNADMLLVYELDNERQPTGTFPLVGLASLGVIPDSKEVSLGNAAALLIDVRSSYQYATVTAQADGSRVSNYWGRDGARADAAADARRETMGKLVSRFASSWQEIVLLHGPQLDRGAAPAGTNAAATSPGSSTLSGAATPMSERE